MMKKEFECSIVQDLLPNYIERLTSEDTNQVIEEHLENCETCKKAYHQMITEISGLDKAPKPELKFIKKVKKTKLFAAIISIILTLILAYSLYAMEFKYSMDKADLSYAITEFLAPFDKGINAYILETKEMDGNLFVSFKDQNHETVNGIAKFTKGFNNKYRIIKTMTQSSKYSSVVQFYPLEDGDDRVVAVSGYNLSPKIEYYGLDYSAYTSPGDQADYRVERTLKFNMQNLQFLDFYNTEELYTQVMESEEDTLYNYHLTGISFYDSDGNEITDDFKLADNEIKDVSSTTGKAELLLLYVFIAIVLGVGTIITRYFLAE